MNNYKVVIVHGAYGSPEENWFPWLQQELVKLGNEVVVPRFPTPEGQSLKKWLEILDEEVRDYPSNLIMVGHSLGPALILSKLEMLKKPIRASFFASPFTGKLGLPDFDTINAEFTERSFDWGRIRANCKDFYIYSSDNDPYVPMQRGKEIADKIDAKFNVIHNGGHINTAGGYSKFDQLLEDIKNLK
ncbi:MAG: alpha/beta hydrolase [Anaerolineales bacterium]|nr:alpha/beta hydrolase [Anaerolineales bacterium]